MLVSMQAGLQSKRRTAPALTYATWNPSDKAAAITLSGADLVASSSSGSGTVRGTVSKTAGKWYFEITCSTASASRVGVARTSSDLADPVGNNSTGWSYDNTGGKNNNPTFSAYGSTYTAGDVISIAVDIDNTKIWWAKNGTWQASGDPAAGTNAAFTNVSGTLCAAWGTTNGAFNPSVTANFGATAFTYTPPTGFAGWSA